MDSFGMSFFMGEIVFYAVFVIVTGVLLVRAIQGIMQWSKNNASPVLTVEAKIVSKRQQAVRHHHNNNNMMSSSTSYCHYVTFQVESGDRIELSVSGSEYGMLVEGDSGRLTFQGTRYKGFERKR